MKRYASLINRILMIFCVLVGFVIGLFTIAYYPNILSINPFQDGSIQEEVWPPTDGILQAIRERGHLRCGVEGTLKYFSDVVKNSRENDDNSYRNVIGFDADYCRVIAASVFGEDYKPNGSVRFITTRTNDRFAAVLSGEIDVLIRNTTHTVGRHIAGNIEFGPTIFYDTQDIVVKNEIESLTDLHNKRVCVPTNSTSKHNLETEIASRPDVHFIVTDKDKSGSLITYNGLLTSGFRQQNSQHCDAISADRSQLISIMNDDEKLLGEAIEKEPLAPVYISGDKQWGHIVDYSIYATIRAAELDITKANVNTFSEATASLSIKHFLGVEDSRIKNYIGTELGIDQKFIHFIIENVGSYEDIYNKNFTDEGKLIFPDKINTVYSQTGQGLLYSPPFTFPDEDELKQFE